MRRHAWVLPAVLVAIGLISRANCLRYNTTWTLLDAGGRVTAYGVRGVGDTTSFPGARDGLAIAGPLDNAGGDYYLFGGHNPSGNRS